MKIKVPFNDTSRLYRNHQAEFQTILNNIAQSGRWILGQNTQKFANQFSQFCGTKYCLPVANGTDALELALRAITPPCCDNYASEVVTTANAGGYTTTACHLLKLTPVYADIDKNTQLINIDSLFHCLSKKVKAIVITHLYGGVVDIHKIRQRLKDSKYENIPIIEDCAQAHGAKIANKRVGSLGDISTFSFYPTKNLGTMGDAGAILTSQNFLFQKLRSLSQYGWSEKYHTSIPYGRNSRMDELQAGILSYLLPYLDKYNNKRKTIYNRYKNSLHEKIHPLEFGSSDFVGHLAVIMTSERKKFIQFMNSKGIGIEIHYPILDCDQKGWANMPMRIENRSNLHQSRQSIKEIVSLPCFPTMHEDEIQYICDALSEWEIN